MKRNFVSEAQEMDEREVIAEQINLERAKAAIVERAVAEVIEEMRGLCGDIDKRFARLQARVRRLERRGGRRCEAE